MVNIGQKISTGVPGKYLFAIACAAMPWIDLLPLATWLFILLGAYLIIEQAVVKKRLPERFPDILSLLLFAFYLLQLVAWLQFPGNVLTRFSLEQKASLLFVPLLLSFYLDQRPDGWINGVKGFIAGCAAACVYCLISATVAFVKTGNYHVFFYHQYSAAIHANAIYMSLYLLVAVFLLLYYQQEQTIVLSTALMLSTLTFFILNIILLSSKTLIVAGSFLLILFFLRSKSRAYTGLVTTCMAVLIIVLALTDNPVRKRFHDMNLKSYKEALHQKDFTNYRFSDLDLRMVLWKMGIEVLTEQKRWIEGLNGRAYHHVFNDKKRSYRMFEGNAITQDTGYINYNLHNQYMENLLQFGIIGLFTLLGIILTVLIYAIQYRSILLLLLVGLFSIAFISESVLETQSGILLFTMFIYGEWKKLKLAKAQLSPNT